MAFTTQTQDFCISQRKKNYFLKMRNRYGAKFDIFIKPNGKLPLVTIKIKTDSNLQNHQWKLKPVDLSKLNDK